MTKHSRLAASETTEMCCPAVLAVWDPRVGGMGRSPCLFPDQRTVLAWEGFLAILL